jgi:predicted Zn-dependent protease
MVTAEQRAAGVLRRAVGPDLAQKTSPAEMRRRVSNLASGTYVSDILAEQDSSLYRWPERLSDAVRVYVEPSSSVSGWDGSYPAMAQAVFDEWSLAGFPLRFAFVLDSTNADLSIRWRDRFPDADGQRIGLTERVQSNDFEIVRAAISIALRDSAGRTLPAEVVGGIVRHEVGHALGLNHSSDLSSVMYREAATMTISASDRATLRLLYLVPGGSLR